MRITIVGLLTLAWCTGVHGQTISRAEGDNYVVHSSAAGGLVSADFKTAVSKEAMSFCAQLGKMAVPPEIALIDPIDLEEPDGGLRFTCQAASSTPPSSAPFGDAKYYVITGPIRYRVGHAKLPVVVPRGFVTDLASVPRTFWSVLPRDGKYLSAAILHDYMYWDQRCNRAEADRILKMNMDDFGVSGFDKFAVYQAVKTAGGSSWEENTNAKKTTIRVIPEPHLTNFLEADLDATRTWQAVHAELIARGVQPVADANNPKMAETCRQVVTSDD
jgi:hypothetical protein